MADENSVANHLKLGDFPYPLPKGPQESHYLTWLRNHSNYMASRGFLDYFRMAGVLVRGVLVNFLILLPALLALSLAISHLYGPQLRSMTFKQSDFADVSGFVNKLAKPTGIDKWLRENLSSDSQAALAALAEVMDKEGAQDKKLAQENGATLKLSMERAVAESKLKLALSKDLHAILGGDSTVPEIAQTMRVEREKAAKEARKKEEREKAPMVQKESIAKQTPSRLNETMRRFWESSAEAMKPLFDWLAGSRWAQWMQSLTDGSRSQRRFDNRLALESAYPQELRKFSTLSEAGRAFDSGLLPPMPVPFAVTHLVLLFALLWTASYPVRVVFDDIAGQRRSAAMAASQGTVNRRDRLERTFGLALLLILAAALFEVLPVLVDKFHQFLASPDINWNAIFGSMAGVSVAVMGGASKLLSILGGAKKALAMLLISLMGVLPPLLVFLYVTEFLVYVPYLDESKNYVYTLLALTPLVFVGGIIFAMGVGRKSFAVAEQLRLLGLMVGVLFGTMLLGNVVYLMVSSGDEGFAAYHLNWWFVFVLAVELWLFCRLVVDVNQTSIHGLYRDRLACAYLVGRDTNGDVAIDEDLKLGEIGCHQAGSTAPYHLVNVCLNLQGSKDISIRDRNSDFFIFSKWFIGGERTGYCRTATMEQVRPQMTLATAMAISAAAASPNMGRGTNPALVAFMVLLNIRLGYWLPNPGRLEEKLFGRELMHRTGVREETKETPPGFAFQHLFEQELVEIEKRWNNVYPNPSERKQRQLHTREGKTATIPTAEHGLVGIGFSGGGIRSATINLGIAQALHERGVFDHVDYMSTVSGGGYLGSSLSALMRCKNANTPVQRSEIEGVVSIATDNLGENIVTVTSRAAPGEQREYRFSRFAPLAVKTGDTVRKDQDMIERHDSLWDRFRWRVHPWALVREMMMKLDEVDKWVNLSDGGHIENLAGIELLRRRCKFIVIGDGEADPDHSFNGLATLIRYARMDLGIAIDIDPGAIRRDESKDGISKGAGALSREHWAFGTITYPANPDDGLKQEEGYLLYLKSSITGDEDEVIKEYRHRNPDFPHESTADQFFDENQFECYRKLGQHIGEQALQEMSIFESGGSLRMTFQVFEAALTTRAKMDAKLAEAALVDEVNSKWETWLTAQGKLESLGLKLPEKAQDALAKPIQKV